MELKIKASDTKITTLTASLEKETAEKEKALDDIANLKSDLEKQKGLRLELETKLTQKQKDVEKTQAQTKDLENKKTGLEAKIKDLEGQLQQNQTNNVELGTIVVSPEEAVTSPATAASGVTVVSPQVKTSGGKILVINKEYNFAVINLGSKDGVNIGDTFAVYHDNNYVGDIKVDKIHDSMSAAGFLSVDIKDKISEGDKVVQKTK